MSRELLVMLIRPGVCIPQEVATSMATPGITNVKRLKKIKIKPRVGLSFPWQKIMEVF